ncbi:hypothetical protein RCXUPER_145 [Rhodobacter phage RcXuper]|nr:hypothetical protein RCXUPER_145 [Rhodobacter phage RcXuper]
MRKPIYVYRPLLNAAALSRYAEAIGLKNVVLPVDMHVTVAYSREPVDWNVDAFRRDQSTILATGGERRISKFGDSVVLEFQSKEISQRWAAMIMAGASWDYPEYRPHVTIAVDPSARVDNIIPPTIDLRFGPERREELDNDWEARTKQA